METTILNATMNKAPLYHTAMTMRLEMQFCRWFLHEADTGDRLLMRRTLIDRGYGVPCLPYFLAALVDHKLYDHLFNGDNRLNVKEFLFAVNIKMPRLQRQTTSESAV